jgi:hypothetical protein
MTFKKTFRKITLTASMTLPSDDKEVGGENRIYNCGIECHVLQRLDRTQLGQFGN